MISYKPNLLFRHIWRSFSKSSQILQKNPGTGTAAIRNSSAEIVATPYGFWMFISYSSFKMLDIPVPAKAKAEPDKDLPFWRRINLGQDKYRYGFAIGSAFAGWAILFVSWTYILRSVRYLVLRKGGTTVSFVTYTPFGQNRIVDFPLNQISANGSRSSGTSQIPIKIKGKWLFYIVDLKEGKFPQPQLFDKTVGTKRKLN